MRGKGASSETLNGLQTNYNTSSRLEKLEERTRKTVFDQDIMSRLMVGKYKSKFQNVPFMKDVVSQHLYREIIQKLQPATIIDLGTAFGGSAMWFSSVSPSSTVLTFDIEDVRSKDFTDTDKIDFVKADICDINHMREILKDYKHPWLISEDCHIGAQSVMNTFKNLMTQGDYIVFEDTHPDNPEKAGMSAETEYKTGTWAEDKLNDVENEMRKHPNFLVDVDVQDFYGYNGCSHINSIFVKADQSH